VSAADPVVTNPFWVLELPASASAAEVERQGQKLLAMLGVGLADATTYPTPTGPRPRDEALVRHALQCLRDPDQRAAWEVFARLSPDTEAPTARGADAPAPWPDALTALGWR
jgi:hypothetical protein